MLRLLYFKVIAQHCIVLICEMITKNQHLSEFVLNLILLAEKYVNVLNMLIRIIIIATA